LFVIKEFIGMFRFFSKFRGKLVKSCWKFEKEERPTFGFINEKMTEILKIVPKKFLIDELVIKASLKIPRENNDDATENETLLQETAT
jgi:hypothetical protein